MKRLIVGFALLAVLLFAGCGGQTASKSQTSTPLSVAAKGPASPIASSPGLSFWTQIYGDEGENDSVASVLAVSEGGFLLAGDQYHYSDTENRDVYRTYLLRTDAIGKQLWKKTINDYQSLKQVSTIFEAADKGFVVFETHMITPGDTNNYQYELFISRIDRNGNELWTKTVKTDINEFTFTVDPSGKGFLISENTFSGASIEILEIDWGGAVTLRKTIPLPVKGPDYQDITVRTARNGDFIIAVKKITGERQSAISVIRIDKDGRQLWTGTFDASDFQLSPLLILETSNGEITLIGSAGPTVDYFRPYAELYVVQ